jgi:hypothetical protein
MSDMGHIDEFPRGGSFVLGSGGSGSGSERQLQTSGALPTILSRFEGGRDGERPMARRHLLGMIQEWPDVSVGLGTPVVAICQTHSASTDLGTVLPSFPRFPASSQAIFISLTYHPQFEGALPAPNALSSHIPCCSRQAS